MPAVIQGEKPLLWINDLHVSVQGRSILSGLNLHIPDGEVHALFGPNGSGKSVLMMTLMGFPKYDITRGEIVFDGRDITGMPIDQRARIGIGICEQRPPVIKGVRLRDLIELLLNEKQIQGSHVDSVSAAIDVDRFLDRGVNDGLSGGESKQAELFLLLLTNPRLLILDEPDSGVDPEHLKQIGRLINASLRHGAARGGPADDQHCAGPKAGLISTHSATILEYVRTDRAHLLLGGKIACSGNPESMMDHIRRKGYGYCVSCLASQPYECARQ